MLMLIIIGRLTKSIVFPFYGEESERLRVCEGRWRNDFGPASPTPVPVPLSRRLFFFPASGAVGHGFCSEQKW